ncbi:hypothetical protein GGF43_005014 [Coemansia sp. RSA 2618]|nr:hypothetical protein GGF43_005014 [Coemansia sp. RSA 2618]
MQTRGSAVSSEVDSTTPPRQTAQAEAMSTRLRSRAKSISTLSEEEQAPQTPTTARGRRSTVRKTSSVDEHAEVPATPTRRSTRTAAIKANDLLHEGLAPASRRRTPARAASSKPPSGQSSGEDAPATPSRRTRGTPAARRSTRASSAEAEDSEDMDMLASPRRRTTRKAVAAAISDETLDAQIPQLMSPPSRRRTARKTSDAQDETPEPEMKTPAKRSRSVRAAKNGAAKDEARDTGLPPAHPDLASAARALAELSGSGTGKTSTPSSRQSVEESFRTAPESPEKQDLEKQRLAAGESAAAALAAMSAAEDAIQELEDREAGDISDLSDVEDPHFTAIMTAEAESATMSAAESIAGSVAGSVMGDSDAEDMDSADEAAHIQSGLDAEEAPVPAKSEPVAADSNSDSDSDDEAPEVVSSKPKTVVADEAVVPDAAPEESSEKATKRRRARHRKRAAAEHAAGDMTTVLADAANQLTLNEHALPREIPAELQLTSQDIKTSRVHETATSNDPTDGKLDTSVLEAFGAASAKRKHGDEEPAQDRKRAKKGKKKRNRNKLSRVVSGIRVVAAKPASKFGLLETLSQSVPASVRNFTKEKHGGSRVKRSVPLVDIAKRNGQPAINFFK